MAASLRQLLETFCELGGFEAQVNVVDTAVLRDAQLHPELARDLVVRVAGYQRLFRRLIPGDASRDHQPRGTGTPVRSGFISFHSSPFRLPPFPFLFFFVS